jgi:B12-binding domain/radical SAM domain protein
MNALIASCGRWSTMEIVLISPGIYTYGAMIIGGILRERGYSVRISRELSAREGETVLLSLYSTLHLMDEGIRRFVAGHREGGGLCYAGGPVSADPRMVIGELGVDAVVLGEGEEIVPALLEEGPSPRLPGIAWREGDALRINPPGELPSVEHPIPLIPDDLGSQDIRGANVYIETHRGCIGSCTFCQVPRFFGRKIRSRELGCILEEVRAFREKGVQRISVSGGTGSLYQYRDGKIDTGSFVELLAGLAAIMGRKNVSAPDIRVDCITEEILEAIRDNTIGWVFFGIESGSDRILRDMGKGVTVAQCTRAIGMCREYGLKVAGAFIVGYPTERPRDYEATKEFISSQRLDDVFASIAEPIPGTPLADLVRRIPEDENPCFIPHTGDYRPLGLTEAEARLFDILNHAAISKPVPRFVDDRTYALFLEEARRQGREIRGVTRLLNRYS